MKMLYNSVNYEDGWEKREKNVKNFKKYYYFIILPQKFLTEGTFYLYLELLIFANFFLIW